MKKIYKICIIPVLIFIFTGCGNDWLDLKPENQFDTEVAITKLSDAEAAVIGIYNSLQNYQYYGGRMQYYGDVTADDMQANGISKRSAKYYTFAAAADDGYAWSLWEKPYNTIRLANNVLTAMENFSPSGDAEKARYNHTKGEALFFRAFAHFDVNKIYGYPYAKDKGASWGAVIVDKAPEYGDKPARSTVAECYTKRIIPDLKDACNLLSEEPTDGFLNKWGAKLLLSRVYLYTGDYKNAQKEAEECIAGAEKKGYRLLTNANYKAGWVAPFNSESLFELVNLPTNNAGNDGLPYLLWDKGYDDIIVTSSFYELLSADQNDVRNQLLTKGTKAPSKVSYPQYILKYANDSDIKSSNIILLRLSEAYLNAAEAAVRNSDNTNAVKYLKAIVERANPVNTVTGTVTLAQVLQERRKELFGEGHRFFDLLRNGLTINRVGSSHLSGLTNDTRTLDWNNFRVALPVPKYETDANPQIARQQNPGW